MRPSADDMLALAPTAQSFTCTDRDYLLYALALGIGVQPGEAELTFVYEKNLRVLPTWPTILAWIVEPTFASLGASPEHALHAGQRIEVHRSISGPAEIFVQGRVVSVHDKGVGRGALIVTRHELLDASDGQRLATLTTSCFARDCGGCGSGGEPQVSLHVMPDRAPDHLISYAIREDAALWYRLTGDRNPLHADPVAARRAGFERPILHGLCTFGLTCRAVLERVLGWQTHRVVSHQARFSAPVYPGENLEVALWEDDSAVHFEARIPARNSRVLTAGRTQIALG